MAKWVRGGGGVQEREKEKGFRDREMGVFFINLNIGFLKINVK